MFTLVGFFGSVYTLVTMNECIIQQFRFLIVTGSKLPFGGKCSHRIIEH